MTTYIWFTLLRIVNHIDNNAFWFTVLMTVSKNHLNKCICSRTRSLALCQSESDISDMTIRLVRLCRCANELIPEDGKPGAVNQSKKMKEKRTDDMR